MTIKTISYVDIFCIQEVYQNIVDYGFVDPICIENFLKKSNKPTKSI
jgi:hypothetical protein